MAQRRADIGKLAFASGAFGKAIDDPEGEKLGTLRGRDGANSWDIIDRVLNVPLRICKPSTVS